MNRRAALLGTSQGVYFQPKENGVGEAVQKLMADPRRENMKVGETLSLKDAPAPR